MLSTYSDNDRGSKHTLTQAKARSSKWYTSTMRAFEGQYPQQQQTGMPRSLLDGIDI